MKQAILYFTGRATDILTTWLGVKTWGYQVEASPVGRWSMETWGFGGYIILNLLISLLVFLLFRKLKRPWLITMAIVMFFGVSIWNLAIYLLI